MTTEMELVVDAGGDVRCIYDEALDLREIGRLSITRASHVEPDAEGYWWADMGPSRGPVLGPFKTRTEALGAERILIPKLIVGQRLWLAADSTRRSSAPSLKSSTSPSSNAQSESM